MFIPKSGSCLGCTGLVDMNQGVVSGGVCLSQKQPPFKHLNDIAVRINHNSCVHNGTTQCALPSSSILSDIAFISEAFQKPVNLVAAQRKQGLIGLHGTAETDS